MSSSSPIRRYSDHVSNPPEQSLVDFREKCGVYQLRLIHLIEKHAANLEKDILAIISVLTKQQLLAVSLDIQLAGNRRWTIGEADLTPKDTQTINKKISSMPNFSENDLREILQDILKPKLDLLLAKSGNDEALFLLFTRQYQSVFEIKAFIDKYIGCNDEGLRATHLHELKQHIAKYAPILESLSLPSAKSNIFSRQPTTFLVEARKLVGEPEPRLTIHNRAP